MNIDIYSTYKKYKVIYADPPWSFNSKKAGGSMTSGSEHQYKSVMSMEDLKEMPISNIADDNCALVMWYVGSQPQEALDLVRAWGFTVRHMNGFVWNKLTKNGLPFFGMGYYSRAGSEMAIIATKGKPSELVVSHGVRQVRTEVVGRHSAKPHGFYGDIEEMFGDVPRIELFARNEAEGWDCMGNEIIDREAMK